MLFSWFALLLAAWVPVVLSDLRARDPEIEKEEPEVSHGYNSWSPMQMEAYIPNHGDSKEEMALPTGTTGNSAHAAQTGNWCAFVHSRVLTMVVSCGTEKFIIKSQNPCPEGKADCQMVMYKLSIRPVYREKQKVLTSLKWKCCPGHTGENCEETEPVSISGNVQSKQESREGEALSSDLETHDSKRLPPDIRSTEPVDNTAHFPAPSQQDSSMHKMKTAASPKDVLQNDVQHTSVLQDLLSRGSSVEELDLNTTDALWPLQHHSLLPQLETIIKQQLWPIWDYFNKSIQDLSQEVGGLAESIEELRRGREHNNEPLSSSTSEQLEVKLQHHSRELEKLNIALQAQASKTDEQLHFLQATVHHNLSSVKIHNDIWSKHTPEKIQANLHLLTESVEEIKEKQEQLEDTLMQGKNGSLKTDEDILKIQEVIDQLQTKVMDVNNDINTLYDDSDKFDADINELQKGMRNMLNNMSETVKAFRVMHMESGLTVETDFQHIIERVNSLATNISALELEVETLNLKIAEPSGEDYEPTPYPTPEDQICDCRDFSFQLSLLKEEIRNISSVNKKNTQMSDGTNDVDSFWKTRMSSSVEDLKQGLMQIQRHVNFQQDSIRMLLRNVSHLQLADHTVHQQLHELQEKDKVRVAEINALSNTFKTLLHDVVRHSKVLQALLGAEVLEFTTEMSSQLGDLSVPAIHRTLQDSIAKLNEQKEHLSSVQEKIQQMFLQLSERQTPSYATSPLPTTHSRGVEKTSDNLHLELNAEPPMGDRPDESYHDIFAMIKALEVQVSQLHSERCANYFNCETDLTTALQKSIDGKLAEATTLQQTLEKYLIVHLKQLINHSELISNISLEASQQKVTRKEERNRQKEIRGGKGGQNKKINKMQSGQRQEDSLFQSLNSPHSPVMFLATAFENPASGDSAVFGKVIHNHGQAYSPESGIFEAPVTGIYLFVLTADFGSGHGLGQLMKGNARIAAVQPPQKKAGGPVTRTALLELKQGEQIHFEIQKDSLIRSTQGDNSFGGVLLFRTV
ncbi:multimerin-2a [Polypterus senegalus]|uniref:multimerin-2a n=1 Tax=Polypterus senegalus TaxID=55291 RepID=UPI00196310ED|nr:multimerin-2a [Polypterus senegalus]